MDFLEPKKNLEVPKKEIPSTKEAIPEVEKIRKLEFPERKKEKFFPRLKKTKKIVTRPEKEKTTIILEKSETVKKIEDILSEGLEDIYTSLPDSLKEEFKRKGEETAFKIEKLISGVKIVVQKIVKLIKEWLKMIPGINRFFIEQESKIKTDKILKLAKEKEKKELNI